MQRINERGHVVQNAFYGELMGYAAIDDANSYKMVKPSESSIANEPACYL